MGKNKKHTITIDGDTIRKGIRKARRDFFIEEKIPHRGHHVHKTIKDYNRQRYKKQTNNDD